MKRVILLTCLLACLAGCAMNRLPNLNIDEMAASGQLDKSSRTPQAMIAQAQADMDKANREELDYYAPMHLAMAEKHLKKAQNLLVSGGEEAGIVTEAAFTRKVVEKGLMVKQTVLRQLDEVLAMKERLDTVKANVHFREEYEDQLDHIKKLIHYIEKGDQDAVVKKKSAYLKEMRTLEVNVAKKITLTEPLEFLTKARNLDAEQLAPKTLKAAEDTMARSTVFIESYPRDDKGVEKAGLDALRASQHVFYVTKEVITIKNMSEGEYENLVLDFENNLNRITLSLGEPDVRYMSLHDQSVALGNKAEEIKRNASTASIASAPAPVARETLPVRTVSDNADQPSAEDAVTTAPAPDESLAAETVSALEKQEEDTLKTGEDMAQAELESEATDLSPADTVNTTSADQVEGPLDESQPTAAEDEPSPPAPALASAARRDKSDEPPANPISWDGSAESFNLDDLYLSDEERMLGKKK